jgi:aminopeptidase N
MTTDRPQTICLDDYTPPAFLIDNTELRFVLGEKITQVRSILSVRRNPQATTDRTPLTLNGEQLQLVSIKLDGESLSRDQFRIKSEFITILRVPARFQLEIETQIKPQENTALEGLYQSSGNFCTQCEAEGFRKITYFLDRPDVMSKFTTMIVADKDRYPALLANGNLIDSGDMNGNQHFATWQDPFPKPCYLFALVAGNLVCKEDVYVTRSGRHVMLRIYVQEHNIDKCDHAMRALKKAMRWDEATFGLEYDLDIYMIVAVDDFNMGAMENKGLNIFNSKFVLARPETATDSDYAGIEGVIAHEYFHNWTGNRVTCRDWFQLSLKEGLTVFRDQEFTADMTSRPVKRIEDVRLLRTHQFPEDSSPMAHPVRPQSYIEINNFYTVTVYDKGAELVRMYQTLFGREGFRKGLSLYLQRHDGRAVTIDDFAAAMADTNHYDLTQFKRWYTQAGTPVVTVTGRWDSEDSTYTLTASQSCPPTPGQAHKEPFDIPLKVGLLGADDGTDIPLQFEGERSAAGTSRVLGVRASEQSFRFVNVLEKPVPSLLRDFSAPVMLRYSYTDEELAFLLAFDSDPFNRWEAGQKLVINDLKRLIGAYQQGKSLKVNETSILAFKKVLQNAGLDRAYVSEILVLPSETYISEHFEQIDVQAIHVARRTFRQSMAEILESELLQAYYENKLEGVYRYNAEDAGRRKLKNLCLVYLATLEKSEYHTLAREQFHDAPNMTDMMGAIIALRDSDCKEREEIYESFHDRWQNDPLVMDKWFSNQAMSSGKDTLEKVRRLREHPLFSIRNPNRVRAVIGAFAHSNPLHFHRADGAGYAFVAEQVLVLDRLNPQVAARLAKAFSRWKKYDPARQSLMQQQLKHIASSKGISRDLYEVVTKSLI